MASRPEDDRNTILSAVLSLAHLFSNTVEAFGLIHPHHAFDKPEQLLLTKLGIQQARLLVWGSIIGISSPPAHIATHMIPTRPAASNPNPEDAVYFGERDARLDDPAVQGKIKDALTDIIDRSEHLSREQMMHEYGLKPSKKSLTDTQPALDTNRLAGFREKYSLLLDLVEAHGIRPPRSHSIAAHSWTISNITLFTSFVALIKSKVDGLIQLFDLDLTVNRAVEIDIRALGWHPSFDYRLASMNKSTLMLINEACASEYPGYSRATQHALDNLDNRWKGSHGYDNLPLVAAPEPQVIVAPTPKTQAKVKKSGFFGVLKPRGWLKGKDTNSLPTRSVSLSNGGGRVVNEKESRLELVRSKSASEPSGPPMRNVQGSLFEEQPQVRDQTFCQGGGVAYDEERNQSPLTLVDTVADEQSAHDLDHTKTVSSMISRHDQWRPEQRFG